MTRAVQTALTVWRVSRPQVSSHLEAAILLWAQHTRGPRICQIGQICRVQPVQGASLRGCASPLATSRVFGRCTAAPPQFAAQKMRWDEYAPIKALLPVDDRLIPSLGGCQWGVWYTVHGGSMTTKEKFFSLIRLSANRHSRNHRGDK
jgi:hypothetical protein